MHQPMRRRFQIGFIAFSVVATGLSLYLWLPYDMLLLQLKPLPDTIEQQLQQSVDHGLDGAVVYVSGPNRDPALYAAGWKDRLAKQPADPESLFKIASVTKLYVAAGVAKLVDAGRLGLDDTLADHIPEAVGRIEHADQITLAMLVGHRSGIPNYTDVAGYDWINPTPGWRLALELVAGEPALFAPGTQYRYSNTNYALLGEIIARATGGDYTRYLRDEILAPLDLKDTFFSLAELDRSRLTEGYVDGYEPAVSDRNYSGAAGGIIASPADTGRFLRALGDGTLLGESAQAIYLGLYDMGHTGLVPGYSTMVRYYPDTRTVVALFVNTSGGRTWGTVDVTYDRVLKILARQ